MEKARKKHAFILTSSGKPIFSNFPNEEELVNTFSFLQAVISVISASNDDIKSMSVNQSKIVFCFRKYLYFIIVSDFDEPESILYRQLEFFYQYILFILTAKVHDLIESNPSIDLTNLLGSDADRFLLTAGCDVDLTPPPIAFNALEQILIEKPLRDDIHTSLKDCVEKCGAAVGLLIQDGMLISNQQNSTSGLNLSIGDALLITNFVNQSQSLKSNDQNWIPVCLPEFNANGYLQAYVANMNVDIERHGATNFLLVLIAQPQDLQNLIKGKNYLEKLMGILTTAPRLLTMFEQHETTINRWREECSCLHFFFRYTTALIRAPSAKAGSISTETKSDFAYFVQSGSSPRIVGQSSMDQIWIAYENLALRVRRATSQYEVLGQPAITKVAEMIRGRSLSILSSAASSSGFETKQYLSVNKEVVDPLTEPTCSDHALSVISWDGMSFLGLASFGCELFVTFPETMPLQDATRLTDQLCHLLKSFVM